MLTKPILEYLGISVELVGRKETGKLVAVGSILTNVKKNDIVWGAGLIRNKPKIAPFGVKFLAVRGPLTRKLIQGAKIPEVYGDPALLLPLFYKPKSEKKYKTGVIPHYIDKKVAIIGENHFIDIQSDWKNVVEEINSCEKIISSSLHGIVIAEAYRIPACWVKFSDNVIGGDFKFHDYLLGTGRKTTNSSDINNPIYLPKIENLENIQQGLLNAAEYLKKLKNR